MKERNGYLFIAEAREAKLAQFTGRLDRLTTLVDWQGLARAVNDATGREGQRPKGGRPPYPTEALRKIVVLQQLYGNLSDEEMEYCLLDRMSWQTFTGLAGHRQLPDARTIWAFKNLLAQGGGAEALFEIVGRQLAQAGLQARGGQIVDATFITVPKTNVTDEERAALNEGRQPESWRQKDAAHKDADARWAKKGNNAFYGYKAHINVDQQCKLIRAIDVTPANVDDRAPLDGLLDTSEVRLGSGKTLHADRGYHGQAVREMLKNKGLMDGVNAITAWRRFARGWSMCSETGNKVRARHSGALAKSGCGHRRLSEPACTTCGVGWPLTGNVRQLHEQWAGRRVKNGRQAPKQG
jgi:IS5 family transposase